MEIAGESESFNIVSGNLIMILIAYFLELASLIWMNINGLRNNDHKTAAYKGRHKKLEIKILYTY